MKYLILFSSLFLFIVGCKTDDKVGLDSFKNYNSCTYALGDEVKLKVIPHYLRNIHENKIAIEEISHGCVYKGDVYIWPLARHITIYFKDSDVELVKKTEQIQNQIIIESYEE